MIDTSYNKQTELLRNKIQFNYVNIKHYHLDVREPLHLNLLLILKYIGKVKRGFRQCRKMSVKGLLKGQSIKICYNAAIMYSNI